VTFVAWRALGNLDQSVVRTVTVLVIACPHAPGLAIPLVIALSTAVSARAGILIKDRLALERTRTVDAVLFDKTGTLTTGAHTVTGIAATAGHTDEEVLRLTGAVESDSEHPLARAIVAVATDHGLTATARNFRSLTGRGVRATVDGQAYAVGGPALPREMNAAIPDDLREPAAGGPPEGPRCCTRCTCHPMGSRGSSARSLWRTRSARRRARPSRSCASRVSRRS
jgi:Cu2+-exporting ATPase